MVEMEISSHRENIASGNPIVLLNDRVLADARPAPVTTVVEGKSLINLDMLVKIETEAYLERDSARGGDQAGTQLDKAKE